MHNNWINIIFDWCVNFLVNVASAIGVSMAINLYFIWKAVRHECVLREDNS